MPAVLAGVAWEYSWAVGEYGSVVMGCSAMPFAGVISPLEHPEVGGIRLLVLLGDRYGDAAVLAVGPLVIKGHRYWAVAGELIPPRVSEVTITRLVML
jgi:hypothetical protein